MHFYLLPLLVLNVHTILQRWTWYITARRVVWGTPHIFAEFVNGEGGNIFDNTRLQCYVGNGSLVSPMCPY
jgi:hypothetical protein